MYLDFYHFYILITKTGSVCNITFIAIKFCRKLIIGILILKFGNTKFKQFRAENFRMVDIEIMAWSSLFANLKTNLVFRLTYID